jgi:catechol 2,3-dioxygenase-like lactoylglutathione lyase family enzyme
LCWVLCCVLLCGPAACAAGAPSTGAAAPAPEPIAAVFMRTMVVVRDIERSKHFYTSAFGFRVTQHVVLEDPLTKAQLGIPLSRRATFALLVNDAIIDGRKRPTASIGLLELDTPASAPLVRPDGEVLAAGEHVMALRTNDIRAVHRSLQMLGARYAVEPVSTADGSATELVVYDPDGVRIHVVQRPDTERDF